MKIIICGLPRPPGLGYYDYETWRIYDASNGLANENISSMLFDTEGRLWLGAYDGTIYRLNGDTLILL